GDMDALDAEFVRELAPALAALRLVEGRLGVARAAEAPLPDQPLHQARIGAAGGDRGGAARAAAFCGQQRLAQRVVGALFGPDSAVEIEAEPRLDHGVDVE